MSDNDDSSGPDELFVPAETGVYSLDNIIERMAGARNDAARLSNRFFILSLIFLGLSLVKIAGLNVPLILLGVEANELQHGLFFFIVAAQLCSVLSTSRTMDSRSYDYEIEKFTKVLYPHQYKNVSATVTNSHEWLTPSSNILNAVRGHFCARFSYNLAVGITGLFALAVVLGPTVLGGIFLYWHQDFIQAGDVDLQYWIVFFTTLLSALWILAYFAIHSMTEHVGTGGADGN